MKSLNSLIDEIKQPVYSAEFSEYDRELVMLLIENSKNKARPYVGDYKAPWLLSDAKSYEWKTTNKGREEKVNGVWRGTVNVRWDISLPDGALLTSPKYSALLDLNQRIAFLVRCGLIADITAPVTWKQLVTVQFALTRWAVLHESEFQPAKFGFKLIDQSSLDYLLRMLAQGGWAEALQYPQRILRALYLKSFGEPCPDTVMAEVFDLPADIKN